MLTYLALAAAVLVNADTLSIREIQQLSAEVFRVDTVAFEGRTAYIQHIRVPGEDHPLADFARKNQRVLTYLAQHASGMRLSETMRGAGSDDERQRRYMAALQSDSGFNAAYLPLVIRYLQSLGATVSGADAVLATTPRAIRRAEYTRIAVRFFSPFLEGNGGVATHICTAFNDVRELPGPRDFVLEALAYAAISAEMTPDTRPRFSDDFLSARRLMNNLTLSSDTTQRLERARGVMWGIMGQSKTLAEVLADAYELRAAYLPFRVAEP